MVRFDEALAQCLNDMEAGSATIEQCLRRYPEHAVALRPLLRTAAGLRNLPAVDPSPAFVAAAPTRLHNLIVARGPVTVAPRPATPPIRRWSAALIKVTVALVLAGAMLGGTAYAARDSLPDSPLYGVKRTVETVQVAAARNDLRRARTFVAQMDQRAVETAAMIRLAKFERARDSASAYLRLLHEVEVAAGRVPADRPDGRLTLLYVRERLLAQQAIFMNIEVNAPMRARALIHPALSRIESALQAVNTRLAQ